MNCVNNELGVTNLRKFSVSFQGPTYYNSLENDIKESYSLNSFKTKLKKKIMSIISFKNLIVITYLSSALVSRLVSSFKLSNKAHLNSDVRLLLELYCIIAIEHVDFFTIWAKLTVAFTHTCLSLNLYTSVFGFEQKCPRFHAV